MKTPRRVGVPNEACLVQLTVAGRDLSNDQCSVIIFQVFVPGVKSSVVSKGEKRERDNMGMPIPGGNRNWTQAREVFQGT
jgi:hypothetical protein